MSSNHFATSFAMKLDTYLTRLVPFGFSGGTLVAYKGKILIEKGYGLADRENRIQNNADTLFNMGSITKTFTAVAIMKLAQASQLSLNDPIGYILRGVPADKQAITIYQLLTHTSGLKIYTGNDYEPASKQQFIDNIFAAPLVFEPGSAYKYSNAGYSLLAAIVEHLSAQPFEDFLYEKLLKPSGMEQTGYTRPDWRGRSIARWYVGDQDNGHALEKHFPSWNLIGNGEMFSTLQDMLHWHLALLSDDLLNAESKARMYCPHLETYACGWRVEETDLGQLVHHNGATDLGNSALFRRYLDAELVLVMYFNQSYGDIPMVVPVQKKIDQLIAGEEIEFPPEILQIDESFGLESFEGKYVLAEGGQITVSPLGQLLTVGAKGQDAINMLAFPAASSETHRSLNQFHQELFQAFFAGDDGPLEEFVTKSGRTWRNVKKGLLSTLEGVRIFFGDFVGLHVAGTVPSSFVQGALDTYIALEFERGKGAILSITQNGKNVGLTIVEMTQDWSLPCVPFGDTLVGYHLPLSQTVKLGVEKDNQGNVVALTTDNGNQRAQIQSWPQLSPVAKNYKS